MGIKTNKTMRASAEMIKKNIAKYTLIITVISAKADNAYIAPFSIIFYAVKWTKEY